MKNTSQIVMGCNAPAPRLTKAAAVLVASALSLPVFLLLTIADLWLF